MSTRQKGKLWLLPILFCLVLVFLLACTPSATPTPIPTPSPTSKPTSTPALTPGPTTKPTLSPTSAPVSFAGKTITIVVTTGPGGGGDVTARLYARYLGRFLPGKPTIVVRNIAGGEGVIAGNYAYFSKPDGLTVLLLSANLVIADLLDKSALKFSTAAEMTAILTAPASSEAYYCKPNLFDRPEDIMKAKGIIFGSISGNLSTLFACIREFIDFPLDKFIVAYAGAGDSLRAFLSGEINISGLSVTAFDSTLRQYYEKGEVKFLCQTGILDQAGNIVRHPGYPPDTVTAVELYEKIYGKSVSGPAYEAYKAIVATRSLNTPFLLPPGTPDDIKKAYWSAAENMVNDPEFIKTAEPLMGVGAKFIVGEAVDKMFKKEYGLKPEVRDWLIHLLSTKYGIVL